SVVSSRQRSSHSGSGESSKGSRTNTSEWSSHSSAVLAPRWIAGEKHPTSPVPGSCGWAASESQRGIRIYRDPVVTLRNRFSTSPLHGRSRDADLAHACCLLLSLTGLTGSHLARRLHRSRELRLGSCLRRHHREVQVAGSSP